MRVEILEETHNRVEWQAKTQLLWIEAGLLFGAGVFGLLIVPSPHPSRWLAAGVVGGIVLLVGVLVAVTTPAIEKGHLERLPDGGDVGRVKAWPLVGSRTVVDAALEDVTGFDIETTVFEDAGSDLYRRSRLWAVTGDGSRRALTSWAKPSSVLALGEALSKAGRRPLELGG